MDVRQNRDIDKVIVLGSGMSIMELSKEEIDYINRCKTVIALNKYMGFYKLSKIIPTHVYFVDAHENSLKMLNYIFKVCKKNKLEGITFILAHSLKHRVYKSMIQRFFFRIYASIFNTARFFKWFHLEILLKIFVDKTFFKQLDNNTYQYIKVANMMDENPPWQDSIHKTLFHFRGSLSTVLNYISIERPNEDIFLVGNDFNGSQYFFEEELEKVNFDWKDWTYEKVKKEGKHFSFHSYQGTKMTDVFPFIISSLEKTNNKLLCNNPDSLLVLEAGVKYQELFS